MSQSTSDEFTIKYLKSLIVVLLLFVLCYSYINQEKYYEVLSTNVFSDLPIYSVDIGDEKKISVTFDSAWGTEDLADILQILEKHHCIATFFVTGDWAEKNPEAITSISDAGHLIGNHSDNHKHMTQLSKDEMIAEIKGCHEKIKQLTGKDMIFFRAPYGDYNEAVVEAAKRCDYYTIQWDVDSLDWKDYGADAIINTVCEHKALTGGSILLLHNGSKYTKDALDSMLSKLEQNGYTFISLGDLIIRDNYEIDHAGKQHKKQ